MTQYEKYIEAQKRNKQAVKVVYCPQCASSLLDRRSLLNSYTVNNETVYYTFCHNCFWSGDISPD